MLITVAPRRAIRGTNPNRKDPQPLPRTPQSDDTRRQTWARSELILAFNLYCKIPFGKIHYRNPDIIAVARLLGRSPSAVSWKLANFARLDPSLKARNIAGAGHGARGEKEVWDEFNGNWEQLAFESERLMRTMMGPRIEGGIAPESFPEGESREAVVRVRVNQAFFRASVLAAYDYKCCITGLNVPELLRASHIVPWSADIKNRTNPRNGVCLNALHDCAFDCGLMTITTDYRVRLSQAIDRESKELAMRDFFLRFNDAEIILPTRFRPDVEFLRYHNKKVFRG